MLKSKTKSRDIDESQLSHTKIIVFITQYLSQSIEEKPYMANFVEI